MREVNVNIHLHLHTDPDPRIDEILRNTRRIIQAEQVVIAQLTNIEHEEIEMNIDVQGLVDEVSQIQDVAGSTQAVVTGLVSIIAQLRDEVSQEPAVQAALDDAVTKLTGAQTQLAAAVLAGTDAEGTTTDTGGGTTTP